MKKIIWQEIFSIILVALFFYTGFNKLLNIDTFANDLSKQPFPIWLQAFLKWTIPLFEIFTGILLLINRFRLKGFYFSLGLLLLFTGYSIAILGNLFNKLPCSCGGIFRHLNWHQHLFVNILLTLIALGGVLSFRNMKQSPKTILDKISKQGMPKT